MLHLRCALILRPAIWNRSIRMLCYKGEQVGDFRADLLVEGSVILELKAVRELNPMHEAQLVNYLVATGLDYGYLINYGGEKFRIALKYREYTPSVKTEQQ